MFILKKGYQPGVYVPPLFSFLNYQLFKLSNNMHFSRLIFGKNTWEGREYYCLHDSTHYIFLILMLTQINKKEW